MITRLGKDSKMVICGDPNQCDLPGRVTSGFTHAQELLRGVPRIGYVTLGVDDIVRHRMMKEIILRYEVPGYKPNSGTYPPANDFYKVPAHTWERDKEGYDFDEDDDLCLECGGSGEDDFGHPCKFCDGSGIAPEEK